MQTSLYEDGDNHMISRLEDPKCAEQLFAGWEETLIWSCLQGVMGAVYGDDPHRPRSAVAALGDFWFFAGEPLRELVLYQPEGQEREFRILIPQSEAWGSVIQDALGTHATKRVRFATKKEPGVFDREKLQRAADSLRDGYTLRMIGEELYHRCREQDWSRDLVSNYEDYDRYRELGIGVMALADGLPVAGASSYSTYEGGIEIEIDTREEYRRQGLAYACGAGLILECLRRGLYPSWDAHNRGSLALAEKLGYHFDYEYEAYEVFVPTVD